MIRNSIFYASGIAVAFVLVSCSKEISLEQKSSDFLTTEASVQTVNLKAGLLAYYPFNSSVKDESGNNLHGINYGALLTKDRNGINKKAYQFNGSSFIDFGNNIKFDPASNNVFTVSIWYRTSALNPGAIISKYWNGYANLSSFMVIAGVNNILALSGNGTSVINSTIMADSWTHLVAEFHNNTGSTVLYLNGKVLNSGFLAFNSTPNNTSLTVGRVTSIPGYEDFFIGEIDDIRIYNRVLNSKEIDYLAKH